VIKKAAIKPAQIVALGFMAAIAVGTVLLSLPISRAEGGFGRGLEGFFTATSAVTVTGLSTVNVETFWTPFGHLVILGLIKIGGFGIITFATLLGVLVSSRIGLRSRVTAGSESASVSGGDVRKLLKQVLLVSAAVELSITALLAIRFMTFYNYSLGDALWHGLFHSVASFNNAGFSLYGSNLMNFAKDPFIQLPIDLAVILGGLGFPVLFELGRRLSNRVEKNRVGGVIESKLHWTLTTRIVLWAYVILAVAGTLYIAALEWNNPATLGQFDVAGKILNAFTASVQPRTAGFNTLDLSQMQPETWLGMDVLMFIGAGSGGTGGGIKVATAAILIFIVLTEIRGDTAVNVGKRRLPRSIQREALTIVLLSALAVASSVVVLSLLTEFTTDQLLFEVVSAFATVGLSTGITGQLPDLAQLVIIAVMFTGRIGTVAVASALASRVRHAHFEYPKERPTIG
jgi:potassium uptake TrkH family protein